MRSLNRKMRRLMILMCLLSMIIGIGIYTVSAYSSWIESYTRDHVPTYGSRS